MELNKHGRHIQKFDPGIRKHHFEVGNPMAPIGPATPAVGAQTVFNKTSVTGGDFGSGPMNDPTKPFHPEVFHQHRKRGTKMAFHLKKAR